MKKNVAEPHCNVCGCKPSGINWSDSPGWVRVESLPIDFDKAGYYYLCPECAVGQLPEVKQVETANEIVREVIDTEGEEDGYWCAECGEWLEDEPEGPGYECFSCGEVFSRPMTDNGDNRCPNCNKFGARMYDLGCDTCGGEVIRVVRVTSILRAE